MHKRYDTRMNSSQLHGRNPDSPNNISESLAPSNGEATQRGLPVTPPRVMKGVSTTVSGRKKSSFLDYNERAVHPVLKLDVKRKGTPTNISQGPQYPSSINLCKTVHNSNGFSKHNRSTYITGRHFSYVNLPKNEDMYLYTQRNCHIK